MNIPRRSLFSLLLAPLVARFWPAKAQDQQTEAAVDRQKGLWPGIAQVGQCEFLQGRWWIFGWGFYGAGIVCESISDGLRLRTYGGYTPEELRAISHATRTEIVNYGGFYLEEQKRLPVSIRDFGAVGDGVTDDSAAIQRACDFARRSS